MARSDNCPSLLQRPHLPAIALGVRLRPGDRSDHQEIAPLLGRLGAGPVDGRAQFPGRVGVGPVPQYHVEHNGRYLRVGRFLEEPPQA